MGIGLRRENWSTVVAKNLAEDEKRVGKGAPPRFYTPPQMNNGNIKTSQAAEEYILAHKIPRLPSGDPITSTERGRRRSQRNGK